MAPEIPPPSLQDLKTTNPKKISANAEESPPSMADSASAAEASPRARRRGTALGASSSRKHPFHQVGKSMKKDTCSCGEQVSNGGMMKDVFIHCRPPSFNPLRFITVRGPPLLSRRSGPPGQVTEALEALPQIHHLKHQPGTCAARNRWRELGPLLRPGLCLAAACSFDRIK